jgi:phage major head subunit gpT-like protein
VAIPFDIVGLYTQALNTAFVNAFDGVVDPPPIEKVMTREKVGGRSVNAPWLYPPPLPHLFKGYRQYAKLGEGNYRLPVQTYTAEFEIDKHDLDDEAIAGWSKQAAQMAKGHKNYDGIQAQVTLAAGQTTTCFDSTSASPSYFFASSHNWGSVNNVLTATTAGTDGVTHAMACLVTTGMVKPLLLFEREAPYFMTDAGTQDSDKSLVVKNWSTSRFAVGFGFPHDAILCKFANTPTVQEVQTAFGQINARFRQFKYPTNLPSDVAQYPHNATKFTSSTLTTVCSSLIEHIVRQALTLSLISQTENYYVGFSDLICSGYMDNVT